MPLLWPVARLPGQVFLVCQPLQGRQAHPTEELVVRRKEMFQRIRFAIAKAICPIRVSIVTIPTTIPTPTTHRIS